VAGKAALALAGLAVLAAAVVLNQSAVHWRQNVVDSQLFGYHGWCVAQGARPYLDVWDNKPPGIWWVNALGFRLCGEGMASDVLIGSVAVLVAMLGFAGCAGAAYHRSLFLPGLLTAGALLTALQFECGANRTETFVLACETAAVCGYLRWLRGRRLGWLVVGGLAAGAAPLFKQSGAAAGLVCAAHLLWTIFRNRGERAALRKPLLVAGGAFVVAPLAAAVVLLWHGALGEAWFAVGEFNQAYFAIDDATWIHMGRALGAYRESLPPLYEFLFVAGLGAVLGLVGCVRNRTPSASERDGPLAGARGSDSCAGVGVLWLWFGLSAYLACVGPGRQGHHLMPVLPSLGLLALYPIGWLVGQRGLVERMVARPSIVCAVVIFGALAANLAAGSAELARQCWKTKTHWLGLQPIERTGAQRRATEIKRLTKPDETIYVWGWSPGTYRHAYRLCASRYSTIEKVGQVGSHAQFIIDGAIADIRRNPPAVFVVSEGDWAAMRGAARSEFSEWLGGEYEDRGVIGGMHVLTRRGRR
jgi:hypothetical protein